MKNIIILMIAFAKALNSVESEGEKILSGQIVQSVYSAKSLSDSEEMLIIRRGKPNIRLSEVGVKYRDGQFSLDGNSIVYKEIGKDEVIKLYRLYADKQQAEVIQTEIKPGGLGVAVGNGDNVYYVTTNHEIAWVGKSRGCTTGINASSCLSISPMQTKLAYITEDKENPNDENRWMLKLLNLNADGSIAPMKESISDLPNAIVGPILWTTDNQFCVRRYWKDRKLINLTINLDGTKATVVEPDKSLKIEIFNPTIFPMKYPLSNIFIINE